MNDEFHQQLSNFQRDYKEFTLKMKLNENGSLLITVLNNLKSQCYEELIDDQYISKQNSFSNIFDTPFDIIEYVSSHFSSVILADGELNIQCQVGRRKPKEIIIKLKEQTKEEGKSDSIDLKLTRMKKQFEKELSRISFEKDEQIKKLEQRMIASEEKIRSLQKTEERSQKQFDKKFFRISSEKDERIKILESKVIANEEKLGALSKKIQELSQSKVQVREEEKEQIPQPKSINKMQNLGDNPDNPHLKHFKTEQKDAILKVTRCTENTWYNFTNSYKIAAGQRIAYKIKIKKLTKQWLGIGFGTKNAFGNTKASQPEGIFYLCNGNVYEFGSSAKSVQMEVAAGDTIETECDLIDNIIGWWKNGKRIMISRIPSHLKNEPFYFMAIMHFRDDQLDIALDQ